jgi:hypothetical protein
MGEKPTKFSGLPWRGPVEDSYIEAAARREEARRAVSPDPVQEAARLFHETYERLAPEHGYRTREASAVPWEDVPAENKALTLATVREVLFRGGWVQLTDEERELCADLLDDYQDEIPEKATAKSAYLKLATLQQPADE